MYANSLHTDSFLTFDSSTSMDQKSLLDNEYTLTVSSHHIVSCPSYALTMRYFQSKSQSMSSRQSRTSRFKRALAALVKPVESNNLSPLEQLEKLRGTSGHPAVQAYSVKPTTVHSNKTPESEPQPQSQEQAQVNKSDVKQVSALDKLEALCQVHGHPSIQVSISLGRR